MGWRRQVRDCGSYSICSMYPILREPPLIRSCARWTRSGEVRFRRYWLIKGITWNGKSWTDQSFSFFDRHVLTGSYHNFFRIYDTDTLNDVVLQADKSAFKAKKIGGPLPGNKIMRNGPKGAFRDAMQLDALDFNKKILHASWHPRENTIAVISSFRVLILASVQADAFSFSFSARSLLRTICSYTVLHDSSGTVLINLRHLSFRFSSSRNDFFPSRSPPIPPFFFYPPLSYLHPDHSFSLRIMALFLMWLDRVWLLWDDLSIKGQRQGTNSWLFLFFLFFSALLFLFSFALSF